MQAAAVREIARALSAVESRVEGYEALIAKAYGEAQWADVIGITGAPGTGKSTLVDALTAHWAEQRGRIAVLAIDPSSPYSGGALLGDRIRRTRSSGHPQTYFRSVASRGHVGGLTDTATDLVAVLSLFGFQRVIIETVGAGQSDVEVHETADCTVVLTVPGLGDGIQASKAGLMEIADIFVVNKADLPRAREAVLDIERVLSAVYAGAAGVNLAGKACGGGAVPFGQTTGLTALRRRHGVGAQDESFWVPPVLEVVATEAHNVSELAESIDAYLCWSRSTGRQLERARRRAYAQVMRALSALLLAPYRREPGSEALPPLVASWIERIVEGRADPLQAARALAMQAKTAT
jgi:LAO/AO transport system kinase